MLHWHNTGIIASKSYVCGYCGNSLASNVGYNKGYQQDGSGSLTGHIYICHHCFNATQFDDNGNQTPGPRFGEDVQGINDVSVESLYREARDAYAKNAYTATVLCCRKLLMHIAVAKGAEENKQFIDYVHFLFENNYIPPDGKDWVDHIRKKGNEANHEISIMSQEEAKELLSFMTMLLKLVYEFPSKMKSKPS